MMHVVTADTIAVTTDIVHSETGAGSDRGAWPAGRTADPRGCGALALAATSTGEESTLAATDCGCGGTAAAPTALSATGG